MYSISLEPNLCQGWWVAHRATYRLQLRIIVPESLRRVTLQRIHAGHQGIEKCRARVSTSVWWPGVTSQMAQIVQQCTECAKNSTLPKEPLIVSKLPEYPWQIVGTDYFVRTESALVYNIMLWLVQSAKSSGCVGFCSTAANGLVIIVVPERVFTLFSVEEEAFEVAALLIILRLWRILRIVNGE